jgi:hypothetical protein
VTATNPLLARFEAGLVICAERYLFECERHGRDFAERL